MVLLRTPFCPGIVVLGLILISATARADTIQPREETETKRQWGDPVGGQAISIATKKPVYAPEEPIVLDVVIKNVSDEEAYFVRAFGLDVFTYELSVVRADGTKAPLTAYGKRYIERKVAGSASRHMMQPGEEEHMRFALSRLFDFSCSGKYTVSVQRPIFAKSMEKATSNKIEITIEQGGPPCWIVKPDEEKPAPSRNGG